MLAVNKSDVRPRSEPALELLSRAASSVGVMYSSSGPGGGLILKKNNVAPKASGEVRVWGWGIMAILFHAAPVAPHVKYTFINKMKKYNLVLIRSVLVMVHVVNRNLDVAVCKPSRSGL